MCVSPDIKRLIYEANPAKYAQYCVKGVVLNAHGIVMSPTSSPAFYGCLVATIRSARAQSQLSTDESQLCSKEARKIVELSPWAIYVAWSKISFFKDYTKEVHQYATRKFYSSFIRSYLHFCHLKKKRVQENAVEEPWVVFHISQDTLKYNTTWTVTRV